MTAFHLIYEDQGYSEFYFELNLVKTINFCLVYSIVLSMHRLLNENQLQLFFQFINIRFSNSNLSALQYSILVTWLVFKVRWLLEVVVPASGG